MDLIIIQGVLIIKEKSPADLTVDWKLFIVDMSI